MRYSPTDGNDIVQNRTVARYPVNEDRSRSQFCRLERAAGRGITGVRRSIGEPRHFAPRDRGPVGRVSAVIVRARGRSSIPEPLIESKGHGALDTSHAGYDGSAGITLE
jgi:hypothetical protein